MAKPDLQNFYVSPAGQPYRDDGESSLSTAFGRLPWAADDTAATASGVPLGGIYVLTATKAVTVRVV